VFIDDFMNEPSGKTNEEENATAWRLFFFRAFSAITGKSDEGFPRSVSSRGRP
jgi:hypothetical protein